MGGGAVMKVLMWFVIVSVVWWIVMSVLQLIRDYADD